MYVRHRCEWRPNVGVSYCYPQTIVRAFYPTQRLRDRQYCTARGSVNIGSSYLLIPAPGSVSKLIDKEVARDVAHRTNHHWDRRTKVVGCTGWLRGKNSSQ